VADAQIVIIGNTPELIVARDAASIRRRMQITTKRDAVVARRLIAAAAPRDTGRLARSVRENRRFANRGGRGRNAQTGFTITAGAVRDNFPYLEVTRHGHRAVVIVPKRGRVLAVHSRGRHSRPSFRTFVRAYHPHSDWVDVGVLSATRAIRKLDMKGKVA